jgi:hypothetical protein
MLFSQSAAFQKLSPVLATLLPVPAKWPPIVPTQLFAQLTLLCRGEENIYLDDFDVKLRKKLLCTLFKKKISIPAETKNESF